MNLKFGISSLQNEQQLPKIWLSNVIAMSRVLYLDTCLIIVLLKHDFEVERTTKHIIFFHPEKRRDFCVCCCFVLSAFSVRNQLFSHILFYTNKRLHTIIAVLMHIIVYLRQLDYMQIRKNMRT